MTDFVAAPVLPGVGEEPQMAAVPIVSRLDPLPPVRTLYAAPATFDSGGGGGGGGGGGTAQTVGYGS